MVLGFSPPPLTASVPDALPPDTKAAGERLDEVDVSSAEARTFKQLVLPAPERTAHLLTASFSLEVLLTFIEHPLYSRHSFGHLEFASCI